MKIPAERPTLEKALPQTPKASRGVVEVPGTSQRILGGSPEGETLQTTQPQLATTAPGLAGPSEATPKTTYSFQEGDPRVAFYPHYTAPALQDLSLSPLQSRQQTVAAAEEHLIYNRQRALAEAGPLVQRFRDLGFEEEKLDEFCSLPRERRESYLRRAHMAKTILRNWHKNRRRMDLRSIPINEQCGKVVDDLDLVYYGALKDRDLLELYGAGEHTLRFISGRHGLQRLDMIQTLDDVLALRIFLPKFENTVVELLRRFVEVIEQYKNTNSHSSTMSSVKEETWMQLKKFVDNAW